MIRALHTYVYLFFHNIWKEFAIAEFLILSYDILGISLFLNLKGESQ